MRHKIVSLVLSLFLLFMPMRVLAATYGSGNYSTCTYSQGCPSSGTPPSTTPILLNNYPEYFTAQGKIVTVSAGQILYFETTTRGTTLKHTITIKTIGQDFVTFTIDNSTNQLTLHIGETQQYDVDGDGQNDIEITLRSIAGSIATMIFKNLSNAPKTQSPVSTTPPLAINPKGTSHIWLWFSLSFIFLAFLIWFIIFWSRRRKHNDQNLWPPDQTILPGPPTSAVPPTPPNSSSSYTPPGSTPAP